MDELSQQREWQAFTRPTAAPPMIPDLPKGESRRGQSHNERGGRHGDEVRVVREASGRRKRFGC